MKFVLLLFAIVVCSGCQKAGERDGDFSKSLREDPVYQVNLNLASPTDYSGIPSDLQWHPMGNNQFCAIQGTVDSAITFQDGKTIREEFSIVYIDRNSKGIFRIRADSLGWIREDKSSERLVQELENWGRGVLTDEQYKERYDTIHHWLNSWTINSTIYEGFRVERKGYDLTFSYFSMPEPSKYGFRYCYIIDTKDAQVQD